MYTLDYSIYKILKSLIQFSESGGSHEHTTQVMR